MYIHILHLERTVKIYKRGGPDKERFKEGPRKLEEVKRYCSHCGKEDNDEKAISPSWWHLWEYHRLSGYFCPECFKAVEHKQGKPINPEKYNAVVVAMQLRKANENVRAFEDGLE